MKLSEYKGEQAIEKLADILEPAAEIMTDKEVVDNFDKNRLKSVTIALKKHSKAVLTLMAVMNGEDPETYKPGVFVLPAMLIKLFNDPEVVSLFTLQGQNMGETRSGSAMESTEDDGR